MLLRSDTNENTFILLTHSSTWELACFGVHRAQKLEFSGNYTVAKVLHEHEDVAGILKGGEEVHEPPALEGRGQHTCRFEVGPRRV